MILDDTQNRSFYEYVFFSHSFSSEDCSPRTAYGIRLYRVSGTNRQELDCIRAITTRKETILWMTQLLNRAQVSPYHFRDVVKDLLAAGTPYKSTI